MELSKAGTFHTNDGDKLRGALPSLPPHGNQVRDQRILTLIEVFLFKLHPRHIESNAFADP